MKKTKQVQEKEEFLAEYFTFFEYNDPTCCATTIVGDFGLSHNAQKYEVDTSSMSKKELDKLKQKFNNIYEFKRLIATTVVTPVGKGLIYRKNKDEQAIAHYLLPKAGWKRLGPAFKGHTGNLLQMWYKAKKKGGNTRNGRARAAAAAVF